MKKIIIFSLTIFLIGGFGCKEREGDVIKIGVILPLSGPAAEIGNSILNGINLAFEELESDITKFEIIIEDSRLDPKTGINAANKLISVDNVKLIIGVASSPVALAVAPICQRNNVIMISATASTPKLTDKGDCIFRIYPSDVYDGEILADFAFNYLEAKTASVLFLNNDFGVGLRDSFNKNFMQFGGEINKTESFLSDATNFRTQLTSIKTYDSDVILTIAIDMQYENIIKQLRELNIQSTILAPVTFDNPTMINNLGNSADGIFYSRPLYDIIASNKKISNFKESYNTKHNTDPPLLAALGYDSYLIAFESLVQNSFDFSAIKDYLVKTSFSGVSGDFRFDVNGDVIRDIEIMKITNNKAVRYGKGL